MGPQYTKCRNFKSAGNPPFHESDFAKLGIGYGINGALWGLFLGLFVGLAVGGPIGALIGVFVGLFSGTTFGLFNAIEAGADRWLHDRLVCLGGRKCAVGTVMVLPKEELPPGVTEGVTQTVSTLGAFDNDEFFDVALMPYSHKRVGDIPIMTIVNDGVQGETLLRPRDDLLSELGYYEAEDVRTKDMSRFNKKWLHCEAEGDFWVRMSDHAMGLGMLAGAAAVVTTGAGLGGAAAGCAALSFLGPLGCIIGAIIGALIGLFLAGGGSALVVQAAVEGLFEANTGDIDDANVGDEPLGTLQPGDRVAVFGEHVYDGLHEGWHEIHPLLTMCKISTFKTNDGKEASFYVEWDPDFPDDGVPPSHEFDPSLKDLIPEDMRAGLDSAAFRERVSALRDHWCLLLSERHNEPVGEAQQGLTHRWTVHPAVDGCTPAAPDDDPPPPPPPPPPD
jgi:hypothetical protein